MNSKLALVTGGNRGIGLEVCRLLADRGWRVVLGSRVLEAGRAAVESLSGTSHRAVALDVTNPDHVDKLAASVEDLGGPDILVNNAAIYLVDSGDQGALHTSPEVLSRTLDVNLVGSFRLCRAFIPGMMRRGFGRVVNVSSGYGRYRATEGGGPSAYRLSKLALNGLTRMLAKEVDGRRVKVNAVDPGWVSTRMGGPSAPRDARRAAEGILWAATLPPDGPNGGFFKDGRPIEW